MARIFISHSSADNAAALAVACWLEANGWSDYFLDIDEGRGIEPGERWLAAFKGAVDRCEAVIFLISPAWQKSRYCFLEFDRAKERGKRIFGVIVEPVTLADLPAQMTGEWQVCDLTDGNDPVSYTVSKPPVVAEAIVRLPRAGLQRLGRGLRKAGLDAATFVWPPQDDPDRSPYPGLRALDEMDAAVFFGRDVPIVRAIDQIRRLREHDLETLLAIVGASGAGKSSFLRAGLLPRLRRDSEQFFVFPTIRPEHAAVYGSQGLLASVRGGLAAVGVSLSNAAVRAQIDSGGLASLFERIRMARRSADPNDGQTEPTFIIPIDQAEELFVAEGSAEARQFLEHLSALRAPSQKASITSQTRLRFLILLTIRSDFLERLQGEISLQGMVPTFFSLTALPETEFKSIVDGPARRHSDAVKRLVISPELTDVLVREARGVDALPLLAMTLEWLYREFQTAEGTSIGLAEYQTLGGVRGVIGAAVTRALAQPTANPQIPAERVAQVQVLHQAFPYLATVDPDTREWKRRVASRQTLRRNVPQAEPFIARLIEQRLLVSDVRRLTDGGDSVEVIEVAHEALLRQWDLLDTWLQEFADDLAGLEAIHKAALEWDRGTCDDVLLAHTRHRLEAAERLVEDARFEVRFDPIDRDYLKACRRRDQKQIQDREQHLGEIARQQEQIARQQRATAQLQRRAFRSLTLGAIMLAGLVLWIVVQTREVGRQTSRVLAGAAEVATDAGAFEQGLRLGILATRSWWLFSPADATAVPALSRAADESILRAVIKVPSDIVQFVALSPDSKRVITVDHYNIARLWDVNTARPVGETLKNGDSIFAASFSPDGKRVITASQDRIARLWDGETGKLESEAISHANMVSSATFSGDGKRIVTASLDWTARVWNAQTLEPVGKVMQHGDAVIAACFSADGTRVVTASRDHTARIWNADTGEPVGKPMTHTAGVEAASFSPDGTRVITVTSDQWVHVWDVATAEPVPIALTARTASFSPDGKRLITTSGNNAARLLDANTGELVGPPLMHAAMVISASFSPDGTRVLTVSVDKTARLWDAETATPFGPVMLHVNNIRSASFSHDGRLVITASDDDTVRVWDAVSSKAVGDTMRHDGEVTSASFSPDGGLVITAGDRTARVWDALTGRPVGPAMTHSDIVSFASFSPNGKKVVTVAAYKKVQVWDAGTRLPLGGPLTPRGRVISARFSPDGNRVVTASWRGPVQFWDAETGMPVDPGIVHDGLLSADLSPDGKRVVTTSQDNTARIWDVKTGTSLGLPMKHGDSVFAASFSADGKRVVTASRDDTAHVWDAETGKPVGNAMKHGGQVVSAHFSPDGRRLVTASRDRTARIWDAETGAQVGEAMVHGDEVVSASFSSDGKLVLTFSLDSTARVWDADTGKPMGAAMTHRRSITAASFSPDGKLVVTASADHTARLWSTFWETQPNPTALVAQVCRLKLPRESRLITGTDVGAARILEARRVGEDVCDPFGAVRRPELGATRGQ